MSPVIAAIHSSVGVRAGWLLLAAAGMALSGASQLKASSDPDPVQSRPNILLILADDMGAQEPGCYGGTRCPTPHLDRLAREGMRFETCYATPVCTPSRVMLLTGRYGFRTGWYNFTGRPGSPTYGNADYQLGDAELTFAELLQQHGYETALAGRWLSRGHEHIRVPKAGFGEHFVWGIWGDKLPEGVRHTGGWENRESAVTERYWHPCLLHDGRYVPTTADDYGPDRINDFVLEFLRRRRDRPFLLFYSMILPHAPHRATPDPQRPDERRPAGLANHIRYVDHLVGRAIAELDRLGLSERTPVLFLGDNGTLREGKNVATERGARVPCIARWPGSIPQGVVSDELTDLTDVLPTFAELAGIEVPAGHVIDGRSLVPTLRGHAGTHREWIFSYLHDRRLLRDKRWLLDGDGRFYDCDTARDGSGYRDVTDSEHPDVLAARRRFERILTDLPAPADLPPSPELEMVRRKYAERYGAGVSSKDSR